MLAETVMLWCFIWRTQCQPTAKAMLADCVARGRCSVWKARCPDFSRVRGCS